MYSLHAAGALRLIEEGKAVYRGREGKKVRDIVLVPSVFTLPEGVEHAAALSLFSQASKVRKLPIVSKHQQTPGGKWVIRFDNADGGFTGGRRSVIFPNNFEAARFAAGKAEQPATQ